MNLQVIKILIPCLLLMAAPYVFSQNTNNGEIKTSCTNVDKKRWLVRKGVMTKDLCLSTNEDTLKVNIVGELFKLGSESYDLMKFTAESGICPPRVDDKSKVTGTEKKEKTNLYSRFAFFRSFLKKLHAELVKRNSKKPVSERLSPEELKFNISSTGYADGVRNLRTVFDKEIMEALSNTQSEDFKELSKYLTQEKVNNYNQLQAEFPESKIGFPLTPEDYKKIACHPHLSNSNEVYFGKIPIFIYKNFLTPLRNVRLANARASTLVNAIFNTEELALYSANEIKTRDKYPLKADIKIANDPRINNGLPICYGYCEGFRGAKVDIKIPTLKEVAKLEKKETTQFPIAFNSPSSQKQIDFNQYAIRDFFDEVTSSALKDDDGTGFKDFLAKLTKNNPKITLKNDGADKHFHLQFPLHYSKGVEEKFIPDFSILQNSENPFKENSTALRKVNSKVFDYLSKNYKKENALNYSEQDRKFITKFLAKRLNTSEEKIKEQPHLLNWAIILYWSRFGTAKVENGKLNISQPSDRNYIDSLYSAELNAPSDQQLFHIFLQAIKDQSLFFDQFNKELKTYTSNHGKNSILGSVLQGLLSDSSTTRLQRISPIYRKYINKEVKYNANYKDMVTELITRYYSNRSVLMYTKSNDTKLIKPEKPISVLTYVNMKMEDSRSVSDERFLLNPENYLTPNSLKIFNLILNDPQIKASIFVPTKLKNGYSIIAAARLIWSASKIMQYHASNIGQKCTKQIKRVSSYQSNDTGNYYADNSRINCTFYKDISNANTVDSMVKVIESAYNNPPVSRMTLSSSRYVSKKEDEMVYIYSSFSDSITVKPVYPLVKKFYATYLLNLKKEIEKVAGRIEVSGSDIIARAIRIDELKKKLTEKETVSSIQGGNDSTIFSFLDYNKPYSKHYSNFYSDSSKFIALPMNSPVEIDAIYYTPDTINTGEAGMKGFYHNACKTGVMFKMNELTKSFSYQSRLKVRSSYYSSSVDDNPVEKAIADFDKTYNLGFGKALSEDDYFNIIRLKHPTAYLLKNCPNKCGCLEDLKSGKKTLKEIINTNLVRNGLTKAIMNFSEGYNWETLPNNKKRPVKKFMLKDLIGKNIMPEESGNYCVITPLVPQTHYVGVGSAEESEFKPAETKNDNIAPQPCPIISVLSQFKDVPGYTDIAKQDEVIRFCKNISDNYPFDSESTCLTKKNNDICSFLDKATRSKFPTLCGGSLYGEALWKKMQSKQPEDGPALCNAL